MASESETLRVRVGHSVSVTFITWNEDDAGVAQILLPPVRSFHKFAWRNPQVALHGNAPGIRITHRGGVLDVDWSRCRWNTVAYAARSCAEAEDIRLCASVLLTGHAHILASGNTHPHRLNSRLPCEIGIQAVRASISPLCQACYQLHL